MGALHPNLRKKLEKTVIQARQMAEKAAESALKALAVDHYQAFEHMLPEQRDLRNKLRSHGKAIGDIRRPKGDQDIYHLVVETAYQHWHRMLFSRFLAENNLLMHPDGVAVTLEECEELGAEQGLDKWELASRYASTMLPAIFRQDDPTLQVVFAPEYKLELEKMLSELEPEVFHADDSLGWVYQFWQAKKKDEVNASEKKIGADELPAVTQLFTEDYMVKFLLHNSLGAWWAGKFFKNHPKIAQNKDLTEDDLRKAIAFEDYTFDYLRFVFDDDNKNWNPAAGCFEGWPKQAKEITIIDPSCGSGHFLVAAFELMVRIRIAEENLSIQEAIDATLKDNIFGLEIDTRCTQIAAFLVALSAWTYPGAEGFRLLPTLNIACSGIPITAKKEDWLELANGNEKLKNGMDRLWTLFRQAPILGSLIDPATGDKHELIEASFHDLQPLLEKAFKSEKIKINIDLNETAVVAQGITQAADILSRKYTLVLTNVPYLTRSKHEEELSSFCSSKYGDAQKDLATVFLRRCHDFNQKHCTIALVTPQNWLFLKSYEKLRQRLLKSVSLTCLCMLGSGAFETITGEVVNVILYIGTNSIPSPKYYFTAIDVSDYKEIIHKTKAIKSQALELLGQNQQLFNPDSRISMLSLENKYLLSGYAKSHHGQGTFDTCCYSYKYWELPKIINGWVLQQNTAEETAFYAGCTNIFRWEDGNGLLAKFMELKKHDGYSSGKWKAGTQVWGEKGIAVSGMSNMYFSIYPGYAFDENVAVIVPKNPLHLLALWTFCESGQFEEAVRKIDRNLKVTCNTLVKIPFDCEYWMRESKDRFPDGLPHPFTNDPTQWFFHGHISQSKEPLQVAVIRLLAYRWPSETDQTIELSDHARELIKKCNDLVPMIDEDGIVCIPAVHGEQPAVDRLRSLLSAAFDKAWSPSKETELLSSVDGTGGLEGWLRNRFFEQHCKLFHHRPFIWHIWDGVKNGFAALINYHKLNNKVLETLTYSYLGDWINKQKSDYEAGVPGAEAKMLAAQILQNKLQLIIKGEKPYDIFVRWKPIHEQPIGWEPDLNDGVRINIRPFVEADILRKKPNVNWIKDRGKDPTRPQEQYPWFWEGDTFRGDRVNDIHLSIQEKQDARERAKEAKLK